MKRATEPKPGNQLRVVRRLYKQRHVYLGTGGIFRRTIGFLVHRDILLYFGPESCTVGEERNLNHNTTHVVFIYSVFLLVYHKFNLCVL